MGETKPIYGGPSDGHGHVRPHPKGLKARCGGPAICPQCAKELGGLSPGELRTYADQLEGKGQDRPLPCGHGSIFKGKNGVCVLCCRHYPVEYDTPCVECGRVTIRD
jgi:hypothetical protein